MAGRGPQSFKKRQKEQQRKEKQQEKIAKRLERKRLGPAPESDEPDTIEAPDTVEAVVGESDTPNAEPGEAERS
ncbi:MAG: hypothetical protein ACRD30_08155 [Bryobacteraceae bacterium]